MLSSIILTEHTSLARVMAFSLPRVLCQCSLFCISALPIDLKNSLALELFHALYIKHFEPRSPNGQAWKELRDLSLLKSRLLKTCGYGQRQGHWSRGVFGGMRHPPDILYYYDQMFTLCYTLHLLFTRQYVHDLKLHVTEREKCSLRAEVHWLANRTTG